MHRRLMVLSPATPKGVGPFAIRRLGPIGQLLPRRVEGWYRSSNFYAGCIPQGISSIAF